MLFLCLAAASLLPDDTHEGSRHEAGRTDNQRAGQFLHFLHIFSRNIMSRLGLDDFGNLISFVDDIAHINARKAVVLALFF